MGLAAKILGPCRVLVVTFRSATQYDMQFAGTKAAGGASTPAPDMASVKAQVGKAPLVVAVCGYGVITKDHSAASDIGAKVTAPGSGFVWNGYEGKISFVREGQTAPFAGLGALAICCGDSPDAALRCATTCYEREARLRTILKPSHGGSILASLLASRLQLPALGLLLLLLAANAAVTPGARDRFNAVRTEKEALVKTIGKEGDSSRSRDEALAQYDRLLPRRFGWLCDRAASALPEDVTLTSLSVQPLLKKIEEGKKPLLSEREMVIGGHAKQSQNVSDYAAALREIEGLARQVRLSAVEFDRDKGVYVFRINVEL